MTISEERSLELDGRAIELLEDFNRSLNAVLMFRHTLARTLELPEDERETVARTLDPTGKVLHRRVEGDDRKLTCMDIQDLMGAVGQCRGAMQDLVGRPIFDDNHPVITKAPDKKSTESATGLMGPPSRNGWTVSENSTSR